MIILSMAERDKFLAWLRQQTADAEQYVDMLKTISGNHGGMIKKKKVESMALSVVAQILLSIETETIGG